jgi:hypothetical protein
VSRRTASVAGIVGPIGFLAVAFLLSILRHDVIVAQGWKSWPSSMALGGPPGIPMICGFLWLGACYSVFALGGLRPALGSRAAWMGLLAVAAGDGLLAFPTDAPDTATTWHGSLHLAGVLLTTVATLVAAAGVTVATRRRPGWYAWRRRDRRIRRIRHRLGQGDLRGRHHAAGGRGRPAAPARGHRSQVWMMTLEKFQA